MGRTIMKSITTAVSTHVTAAAIRAAWATIRAGARLQALGEKLEARVDRWPNAPDALDVVSRR